MKLEDYISQMGGLMGLGIGFSFVSAVEILYWLTIRLYRNVSAYNKATSRKAETAKKKLNQSSVSPLTNSTTTIPITPIATSDDSLFVP